jgi:hypothetical protein
VALLVGAEDHLKAGKVLTSMKLHLASRRLTSVNFDWSLDGSIGSDSSRCAKGSFEKGHECREMAQPSCSRTGRIDPKPEVGDRTLNESPPHIGARRTAVDGMMSSGQPFQG